MKKHLLYPSQDSDDAEIATIPMVAISASSESWEKMNTLEKKILQYARSVSPSTLRGFRLKTSVDSNEI